MKTNISFMQRMLLMVVGLVCASFVYDNDIKAATETAYAIWCKSESSLIFLQSDSDIKGGDTYQGHVVTTVWKADEVTNTGENDPGWRSVVANSLTKVVFDKSFNSVLPSSTYWWFRQCKNLETIDGIENLNTSEVTTMRAMFSECENLKGLDVSGFNTSKVKVMRYMFANCFNLTQIDVKGFDTGKVEDMCGMFRGCRGIIRLNLNNFNTDSATDMSQLFYGCSSLREIDLKSFSTGKVVDMSYMFRGCSSITNLDLISFNTENVTDMTCMFYDCSSLTGIDVSSFNTSNVREMPWMFYGCKALTQLDVSNFNTENVVNMRTAFGDCQNLKLLDLNNWNTCNVENMRSLFYRCARLSTLKIANFNTEKVKDMKLMFFNCSSLDILDLRSFNTEKVEIADSLFFYDKELHSVYVGEGWQMDEKVSTADMFYECIKLVGEKGTTYNSKYVGGTYAHIDEEGRPGYFRTSVLTVKPVLTLTCSEGGWMEFMGEKISGFTKSFLIDKGADVGVEYRAKTGYDIEDAPEFSVSTGTSFGFNSHQCSVYGMTKDVRISINFIRNSEPISQIIEFAEASMQTFCSKEVLDFTNVKNLDAYIASGFSTETGEVIMSRVDKVPAKTGVLLRGLPNTSYEVPFAETDFIYSNFFVGVTETTDISSGYVFIPESSSFEAVDGSQTVNAGEAYLNIPSAAKKQLNISFTDTTTGVEELKTAEADDLSTWYTLQGTRLAGKPSQGGIYLHGGKKVLLK